MTLIARSVMIIGLVLAFTAPPALGAVTFNSWDPGGSFPNLKAQATFSVVNNQLKILLTNNSTFDVLVPADVLTALFFDLVGDPQLIPVSATLPTGAQVFFGGVVAGAPYFPSDRDVGTEWAFSGQVDFSTSTDPALKGIYDLLGEVSAVSAAGFDIFGPHDMFNEADPPLYSQTPPDGLAYGILSSGDNPTTGNAGTQAVPLIKSSVEFILDAPTGYTLTEQSIRAVRFQYGTDFDEPYLRIVPGSLGDVPEPASLVVWSAIAGAVVVIGRLRKRASRDH